MLEYLAISSFAVIDRAELELEPGVTVFTGETGAGKSILVQAIDLLRGAKGSASIVRTGREQAKIEAVFAASDGGDLVVERTVSKNGRSRARVNGDLVPLKKLGELVAPLVEISSQHEQQRLLKSSYHTEIIDEFLGIESLREELANTVAAWRRAVRQLEESRARVEDRHVRRVYLEEMLERLDTLAPRQGEYEELEQELDRLANISDIITACTSGEEILYSAEGSVSETIHRVIRSLESISALEPRVSEAVDLLSEAAALVEESASVLGGLVPDDTTDAEARMEAVQSRLAAYESVAGRLGMDPQQLPAAVDRLSAELQQLEDQSGDVSRLEEQVRTLAERVRELDLRLSEARRKGAPVFAGRVEEHLADLGLLKSEFVVRFEERCSGDSAGDPACIGGRGSLGVVFMLAPNPGEEPRPIGEGASGGELSRIHLAVRAAMASGGSSLARVTVYDEVDAGIGGMTAWAVGGKLAGASRGSQVICITHLPQIAAFADSHFTVEKVVEDGRTVTRIRRVEGDQRVTELARMIGGTGAQSRAAAEELLDRARQILDSME